MQQYLDLLEYVIDNGKDRGDRTGTGTRSVFVQQMRFDLQDGFPMMTTKKLHWKSIVGELLWFLKGDTNVKWLQDNGISIWNEWADEDGNLGPVYGYQWRHWDKADGGHVDQVKELIDGIKNNPFSRRHIISSWNVGQLDQMALPPCHAFIQFYVDSDENGNPVSLSCHLYQRSADIFLGVPFNIASYALLTHIIAKECGLEVGEFIHTFGDLHLYSNHFEQAKEQLSRTPRALPTLVMKDREKKNGEVLPDYEISDFSLEGYNPYPNIKAKVSV